MSIKVEYNVESETPEFPAFYTDHDGDLWYFQNEYTGVWINDDAHDDASTFDEATNSFGILTRVVGTITITQE